MNERIKELEKQATDYYSNGQERIFDRQKFAELILQEIIEELEADVIDMYDDPTDYERGYDEGVKNSTAHIKEHFGVEE